MTYILSSYGPNNPFIWLELPEHAVYPVTLDAPDGMDLDYTSLLIGQGYSIDVAAYEIICNGSRPFLAPMSRTLRRLKEEGFLTLIDVKSIVDCHRTQIEAKVNALSEDVCGWLPLVRDQWRELKDERPAFQAQYGSPDKKFWNLNHATVLNALRHAGLPVNQTEADRLTALIEKPRKRLTAQEESEVRLVIQPLIAHLIVHDLIRAKHGGVILDWDDSHRYYERIYLSRWDAPSEEDEIIRKARVLLSLTMPSLKSNNIDAVIRFVRDNKAVQSLRSEILRAIKRGEIIDTDWWSRYLLAVIQARIHKDGIMKKVRFGGSVAGLLIPGAGLATEVAAELFKNITEEVVEGALDRREDYWFYALQRASDNR